MQLRPNTSLSRIDIEFATTQLATGTFPLVTPGAGLKLIRGAIQPLVFKLKFRIEALLQGAPPQSGAPLGRGNAINRVPG
jgi:hypothetical protein